MRIDAWRVVSELAAAQHGVLTRRQAADRGIHRNQLRRLIEAGLLVEVGPGALVLGAPGSVPTWTQRLQSVVLVHPGCVVSHASAARRHGWDGFVDDLSLHVSIPRPAVVRWPGVTVHRVAEVAPSDIVVVDGLATTNVARTLCDLAATVPPLLAERAFDDAIRRGANPRWLRSTAERMRVRGRHGPALVLDLLDGLAARGRVRDSWFEKLVELCIADAAIGPVVAQYELRDGGGRHVARFDLAVPDVRLAVEAHSREHHYGEAAEASDERRDHEVALLGWDVMYIGYGDLRSPSSVRRQVAERVAIRRATGHGP